MNELLEELKKRRRQCIDEVFENNGFEIPEQLVTYRRGYFAALRDLSEFIKEKLKEEYNAEHRL